MMLVKEDSVTEYNIEASESENDDDVGNECGSAASNDVPEVYVAKSGRCYVSEASRGRRRHTPNIVRERSDLRPSGRVNNVMDSFVKFFTPEILRKMVQYTNKEAQRRGINETNEVEMTSLIGSIRGTFQLMNDTFLLYYSPSENVVADEMLSLFRGRCPFKVFMKEKPVKYGIVIKMLADYKIRYILRMEVYVGKSGDSISESRGPTQIVKRLAEPLRNSGRNITTDRYYTSVDLAEELYNDFGLTLVGTMQINRKHIPEELKVTKDREVY